MSDFLRSSVDAYRLDGFFAPLNALSQTEAAELRRQLEQFERMLSQRPIERAYRRKLHVRLHWVRDLVENPRSLDAVERIVGPDILVYTSTFFIKEAGSQAITAWHQDGTCFGLAPPEHVTAWIALSDASELAGCMRFVPGSHARGQLRHEFAVSRDLLNYVGQYLNETFDDEQTRSAPLRAGQFSLHHTFVIHASEPNRSNDRRIGLGISYIPTRVTHNGSKCMSATLVRGVDRFAHFSLEPDPRTISAEEAQAAHLSAYERYRECWEEQMKRSMAKPEHH